MSVQEQDIQRVIYVPPGAGESRWVFGDRYILKGGAENTAGVLTLIEALIPPQGGPPPHLHRNEDEAFYLLEGELEVLDHDRTFVA